MSAATSSAKQTNVFSEENEALYDPYWGFALYNLCTDLPWPEWTDAELNAQIWDEGKGGKATAAAGAKLTSGGESGNCFDDPEPPRLPPSISKYVAEWKRPQNVFPGAVLTVYDPTNVDFVLQLPSNISSGWNFLTVFVEQLTILQFYARKYGFQVELENPNFVANTQGDTWRPWHHVYALCKAGKGQVHKPLYCPYGKYVLRLFYMGMWRRFVVDDKIPCDFEGNCILPTTQFAGELWPIILAKGILKILSLTPVSDFAVTDLPLVSVFTGWTHGYFPTENKTADQVWRRLGVLIPHFEPLEKPDDGKPAGKNPNSKESRKSPVKEEVQGERFCCLLGNLVGISLEEDPPVDCTVALTMTRDRPLVKAVKREGTKPWKRIRWTYWAKEKGLWIDENVLPPYRRLQVITFFQELSELLIPDPKLEAALYDIPIEEDSGAEEEVSARELKVFEPEQWWDYLRFLEYLVGVNVFFKPSFFISNFKVSCLKEKVMESPRMVKGTSKPPPPQNIFIFSTVLKPTCNEPVYLLCEALTGIFLCISVWVCPQREKTEYGYLDLDQPKVFKVGHASMVVEVFDWRVVCEGEIIGMIKTVGYSSTVLNLKPGRHILKLWLYSDSSYVVDVNSNVNVIISKCPKVRFLMNTESQQILQYVHNVSNSFTALTQKFGKPDFPAALRDFYETIKPKNDSARDYYRKLDGFIENFLTCILLVLKDLVPQLEELTIMMWALRTLFINPDIGLDLSWSFPLPSFGATSAKKPAQKIVSPKPVDRTLSQMLERVSLSEVAEKVVTIQRIFRGFRVRLLWKYQTPARREFKPFADRLKKICDLMFSPPKRETEVGKLLRRIIMNKPDLLTTFKFHTDFSNVIQVEEFTGKIPNVEPFAWVPIARFVVACHCNGLPAAFYLSCNLEQSVIQGFDNDSNNEIFRLTNAVSPFYYHTNMRGYTILVFGWNEANVKTVNWRLEMVKMKHFQSVHLCNFLMASMCQPYPMPTLDIFEIRNFYIPNSKSRILRCLIKIQKRTLLTLRLSLSYSRVNFVVVLTLDEKYNNESISESVTTDRIVTEVVSTNGAVIMPSLLLEYVEGPWSGELGPESTVYVLEAYVINNSWPLTKQEWGLVEPIRVNGENWKDSSTSLQSKRTGSESRRKVHRTSRRSTSEQKIENPYWLLQVLNDAPGSDSQGEGTVIEEDKSYAESVKAMKLVWEENDPGRRKRGRDLRMKFVYQLYLEQKKNNLLYGEDMHGEEMYGSEKDEDSNGDPQAVLDRLSSFTYLINDPSTTRYICSPRILPVTHLTDLLYKYSSTGTSSTVQEVESKETQFTRRHEGDTSSSEFSVAIVREFVWEMEEERVDFLRQCLHYRYVLSKWLSDEEKLSNLLMEQAYDTRANVLERMLR